MAKDVPITARVIIEVVGKPKEHVEKTIKDLVGKAKSEESFEVIKEEIAPVKEQENNLFGTFAELDIKCNDIFVLGNFCFNYMPSSIEILEPESLKLLNSDIANVFNDLQAKLHKVDMVAKQLKVQNSNLNGNIHGLLKNFLIVLLKSKPMKTSELCKFVGTDEKSLQQILDQMIKDDFLKKQGEEYSIK